MQIPETCNDCAYCQPDEGNGGVCSLVIDGTMSDLWWPPSAPYRFRLIESRITEPPGWCPLRKEDR